MLVQHPSVLEAGVVAVPDSQWGERPKAFITVKEGARLKGEDLISWAKEESGISRYMVPREVEVVGELPKTVCFIFESFFPYLLGVFVRVGRIVM